MTEEEKKELADAFRSYDWIILNTNPITEKLDLSRTIDQIPSSIRKDVDRFKQQDWPFNKNEMPPDILSSISINFLLSDLVEKGIPLYKIGNKEITCIADIRRLWNENGLSISIFGYDEPSYTYKVIRARLTSQRLKIEKELIPKLDIEKKSETTGKKIPRGQKKAYVDPNILNEFLIGIIKEYPSFSHGQIAKKACERMKTDGKFQGVLYKERTLINKICELKKTTNYTKPSFSKLKNDGKVTAKKRHLKSDVKT